MTETSSIKAINLGECTTQHPGFCVSLGQRLCMLHLKSLLDSNRRDAIRRFDKRCGVNGRLSGTKSNAAFSSLLLRWPPTCLRCCLGLFCSLRQTVCMVAKKELGQTLLLLGITTSSLIERRKDFSARPSEAFAVL